MKGHRGRSGGGGGESGFPGPFPRVSGTTLPAPGCADSPGSAPEPLCPELSLRCSVEQGSGRGTQFPTPSPSVGWKSRPPLTWWGFLVASPILRLSGDPP